MASSRQQPLEVVQPAKRRPAFGFDRLTFWFDRPQLLLPLSELRAHARLKHKVKNMTMNRLYQLKIEVFQPSPEFFDVLLRAVGLEVTCLITEAELVCDVPVPTDTDAANMLIAFMGQAHAFHQRQKVRQKSGTFYYARRRTRSTSAGKGRKSRRRLVAYADRVSKLASPIRGQNCLHVEWRIFSSTTLREVGIGCVQDLKGFDHRGFWDKLVAMLQLPSMTQQGRLAGGRGGGNVSDAAMRKRARALQERSRVAGVLVMQHLLRNAPNVARASKRISFTKWARSCTDSDTHIKPSPPRVVQRKR